MKDHEIIIMLLYSMMKQICPDCCCVSACVCVSSMKTVLTIMGILNLNQATAAIKRCCHGNDGGKGEKGSEGGGRAGKKIE